MTFVLVDPPSPPGFVSFRHAHGGYGEFCRSSRLKVPTLDIFHAAGVLRAARIPTAVVDCVLLDQGPKACVEAVLAHRPSRVVFRTASGSFPHDLRVAGMLRKRFDGPILFCGPHAAVEAEAILDSPAADAVLTGDYPALLPRIVKRGFDGVPGVRFRRRGAVIDNGPAPRPDLDALPVPAWDLVDYRKYSFITSQTSWGCPSGCGYCPYPVTQGRRWRTRSEASVVREFQALRARFGLRFVMLRDPFFTCSRERTVRLSRALIRAKIPMMWGCETRLDSLDDELIALMAEAGCVRVVFGVESVRPSVLRRAGRKPLPRRDLRRTVALLKRHGMLTYAFYMIGLPGETKRSTLDMIDFALSLATDAASFSAATPFHGTRLAERAHQEDLFEARDPLHLTSCVPSIRSGELSAGEIGRLYRLAKKRWRERN